MILLKIILWFYHNKNDIIIKSLEDSGVLNDGVTETANHEIKKQEGRFPEALLTPVAVSLVHSVLSSVVKGIIERGIRRAGTGYMDKNFYFCSIL